MSPWSHNALQVVVCPDQVTLLPARRRLSWRGLRHTTHDPHAVSCDGTAGGPPWRAALQALEAALPDFRDGHPLATVILSNHFMRYALVPWSENLANAEEEQAFTGHCFTRVYGQVAERWALRLDPGLTDAPRLASAMDGELLDGLRGVFEGAGITLKSIQPHLMAAFNGFRGSLRQHSGWFALLEPGNLCLALLHCGRWVRVRNLRIGGAWREELPVILEREAVLADHTAVPHEVYLWDAESGDAALPESRPWTFHALSPEEARGGAVAGSRHFALAVGG